MVSRKAVSQKSMWTPARVGLSMLVFSLVAAFGVASCNSTDEIGKETRPAEAPKGKVNPPQPNARPAALASIPSNVLQAEMRSVSGTPIRLSNYAGKVLIVNLWATWCGPCRVEIPELVKLYSDYKSKGVEVVGLSTENPEASAAGVKEFVQNYDINYKVGWATTEVALTLMQGRDAIPQSFVIGRDGRIVRRFVGFNPNTTPPLIKQAVEEALKG
ncbi:MAG TPA: TlpA disulfide reductase family protein [Pyrinomonadaceae bacterium]|jgi:glutathione peroxidase-family protein